MTNKPKTVAEARAKERTLDLVGATMASAQKDHPSATHGALQLEALIRLKRAANELERQIQKAAK